MSYTPRNCNICNTSLPIYKKRFCDERCRQKWYKKREVIENIKLKIELGRYNEIHTSVAKLIEYGFNVRLSVLQDKELATMRHAS